MEIIGEISTLLQVFDHDGVKILPSINDVQAIEIYHELLQLRENKPLDASMNMRKMVKLFVSKEANKIQITNVHVIGRVSDLLIKSTEHQILSGYQKLASQVNDIIKHRGVSLRNNFF